MYICRSCKQSHPTQVNFCSRCGSSDIAIQGEIQQPYSPYNVQGQPFTAPNQQNNVSIAPAIVGMVFGFIALICAFITLSTVSDMTNYYGSSGEAIGFFLVFSAFTFPFNIVGLVQSGKPCSVKGLAIAGRIINFVSLGFYALSFIVSLGA